MLTPEEIAKKQSELENDLAKRIKNNQILWKDCFSQWHQKSQDLNEQSQEFEVQLNLMSSCRDQAKQMLGEKQGGTCVLYSQNVALVQELNQYYQKVAEVNSLMAGINKKMESVLDAQENVLHELQNKTLKLERQKLL